MKYVINSNGVKIKYDLIRLAMQGKPFKMETNGTDTQYVTMAVNKGIDSHLEACNCPDLGDAYLWKPIMMGNIKAGSKLHCTVSVKSFPVLVRRLFEIDSEDAWRLADGMLESIGINEYGKHEPPTE